MVKSPLESFEGSASRGRGQSGLSSGHIKWKHLSAEWGPVLAQWLAVLVWSDEWGEDWEMHVHECQLLCRREAEEGKEACEPGPACTCPVGKTHQVQGSRSSQVPRPALPRLGSWRLSTQH